MNIDYQELKSDFGTVEDGLEALNRSCQQSEVKLIEKPMKTEQKPTEDVILKNSAVNEVQIFKAFKDQKEWLVETVAKMGDQVSELHGTVTDLKSRVADLAVENKALTANLKEKDKVIYNLRLDVCQLWGDCSKLEETTIAESQVTTVEPWQKTDELCPRGWHSFRNNCYLYNEKQVTYTKARSFCAKKGGHIVDIQSEEENTFVSQLSSRVFAWIGLTDVETEGQWKWDRTGSLATYTNWRPGQPDNAGSQNYALIGADSPFNQWNDAWADIFSGVVCKL